MTKAALFKDKDNRIISLIYDEDITVDYTDSEEGPLGVYKNGSFSAYIFTKELLSKLYTVLPISYAALKDLDYFTFKEIISCISNRQIKDYLDDAKIKYSSDTPRYMLDKLAIEEFYNSNN